MSCLHTLLIVSAAVFGAAPDSSEYFKITVVDQETGRGVPLVELRTVNNIRLYTDSAGVVAFYEPGLMNQRLFFRVQSHGYEFAKDGFGFRGARLKVKPGASATLKIKRLNVAERLYRMTGAGIYRDSVLVGDKPPIDQPLLNGSVFGSDSVVNAVYRGKIFWFWGDTNRPSYPLGNFHVPGATSLLPEDGGLDPNVGVNLRYFVGKDGFAKPTAQMPGKGPTWIDGVVTVKDREGRERLFAKYVKIKPPMVVYERGLIEFDDQRQQFGARMPIPLDSPLQPTGHPLKHVENEIEYVYFGHPYPRVRVRASAEDVRDLSKYEAYTCLREGARANDESIELDRDRNGELRFAWKQNTPPVVGKLRQALIRNDMLREHEGLIHLRDVETGKQVAAHGGSVYWNDYRQRWVAIILQSFGASLLGEIWYAESDTPLGPWVYARKVVTHDKYSFYNPKQHPMLDQDQGRTIFFEGTYTNMFSGNPDQTPRYNYNQIMYKLDLADARIALPAPVYDRTDHDNGHPFTTGDQLPIAKRLGDIGWFALDRPTASSVPVIGVVGEDGVYALKVAPRDYKSANANRPLFHAIPADVADAQATMTALYEFQSDDGKRRKYSTSKTWDVAGFRRTEKKPVCLVWPSPMGGVAQSTNEARK